MLISSIAVDEQHVFETNQVFFSVLPFFCCDFIVFTIFLLLFAFMISVRQLFCFCHWVCSSSHIYSWSVSFCSFYFFCAAFCISWNPIIITVQFVHLSLALIVRVTTSLISNRPFVSFAISFYCFQLDLIQSDPRTKTEKSLFGSPHSLKTVKPKKII